MKRRNFINTLSGMLSVFGVFGLGWFKSSESSSKCPEVWVSPPNVTQNSHELITFGPNEKITLCYLSEDGSFTYGPSVTLSEIRNDHLNIPEKNSLDLDSTTV